MNLGPFVAPLAAAGKTARGHPLQTTRTFDLKTRKASHLANANTLPAVRTNPGGQRRGNNSLRGWCGSISPGGAGGFFRAPRVPLFVPPVDFQPDQRATSTARNRLPASASIVASERA